MESKFILESVIQEREPVFNINSSNQDNEIVKNRSQIGEILEVKLHFVSFGNTSSFTNSEITEAIWKTINELKKIELMRKISELPEREITHPQHDCERLLRDQFAISVMNNFLINESKFTASYETYASMAYKAADAMLKQREA